MFASRFAGAFCVVLALLPAARSVAEETNASRATHAAAIELPSDEPEIQGAIALDLLPLLDGAVLQSVSLELGAGGFSARVSHHSVSGFSETSFSTALSLDLGAFELRLEQIDFTCATAGLVFVSE